MKNTLLAALLLTLVYIVPCQAGSAYFGSWTKHFDNNKGLGYTDTHDLIGIQSDSGYFAMTMVNSYYKRSFLAGREFGLSRRTAIKFGAATGYEDFYKQTGSKGMPFVALSYTVGILDFELIPGSAVSAGIKFKY
jgi:hypothetical protein